MGIKKFRPTSPGRRFTSVQTFEELTSAKPLKSLTKSKKSTGGRNNLGKITSRFRGGGHKRRYRIIDFKRDKFDVPAKVASIEYDPNRSARIALLHYADGEKRYILHPVGLEVGGTVVSSNTADILPGNSLVAREYPGGHHGAQHRAQAGQRRTNGTQRGRGGAAGGQGRQVRAPQTAFR